MGNCDCNVKDINENLLNDTHIKLDDFYLLHPIGRGGFGKVWQVTMKKNNKKYGKYVLSVHSIQKYQI